MKQTLKYKYDDESGEPIAIVFKYKDGGLRHIPVVKEIKKNDKKDTNNRV